MQFVSWRNEQVMYWDHPGHICIFIALLIGLDAQRSLFGCSIVRSKLQDRDRANRLMENNPLSFHSSPQNKAQLWASVQKVHERHGAQGTVCYGEECPLHRPTLNRSPAENRFTCHAGCFEWHIRQLLGI